MAWKNKIIIILILIISITSIASNYESAYTFYLSGLKAFRSGDYEVAETFLMKSLESSAKIEADIPEIKLYLGLSAFHNQKYDLAEQLLKLFPENSLAKEALNSIKNNNLTQELNFDEYKITQDSSPIEEETKSNNTGTFIIITVIIFIVSALISIMMIFILRKTMTIKPKKSDITVEEIAEKQIEETPKINLEEVMNLKLDNLDTIWQKSSALKKLLGEIDDDIENNEINEESATLEDKTDQLKDLIDESLKEANIDEIESLLNNLEDESFNEKDSETDNQDTDEKLIESENKNIDEKLIETENQKNDLNIDFKVEAEENQKLLDEIDSNIKADTDLNNKFKSIMKEDEIELVQEAETALDLEKLIQDIEEYNKEKGSKKYSQTQLDKIFKNNFFKVNIK
ncbi:hypothetical protein OF820_00790 [Oceanotoga sp. DSM 15011]|jgi:hypothetical protein|uniref:hypothetical protein n=1 Tax=unclassified Oceanotoga TaxID=2618448 RepID=UPI0021F49C42|nr:MULTISPECIES: hypothetical protein [unclassified Oceanotoga]MDN5341663.1 hypothetical protein [Oceanotoga sp.]UYP00233.1 hypothetical protein OF820_00790 [Oceanotoga sp. DSM 15011]